MVRVLVLIAQTALAALIAYNSLTAIWGWPNRVTAPRGRRDRLVRIVVPAHNEERVIGKLLADLSTQQYAPELISIWLVADRCDDHTAAIARAGGAQVEERRDGEPGKGAALAWHLNRHPLEEDEILVIFDADNRVGPHSVGRIVDEIEHGHSVVQCYIDATNPDSSLIAEAAAMSYWAGNRMVQLARANLGWSSDLGGTGMAMIARALEEAGGFGDTVTEDQDLGVRFLLAGHRVEWVHDVRIGDEKPASVAVTVRQRARWMAGKRKARRRHLLSLMAQPTMSKIDMAIRLVQPGRSFVALLTVILAFVAATWPGRGLFPWPFWAITATLQFVQPIPFLAREGLGSRRIARYPLLALLAVLWLPIRLLSGWTRGWYHTPHTGDVIASDGEADQGP